MDYLKKPEELLDLPEPKAKKVKKDNYFLGQPLILIVIISFLVGSMSGAVASLIINGSISNINLGAIGLGKYLSAESNPTEMLKPIEKEKIVYEDDLVTEMIKKASPSVASIMATEEVAQYVLDNQTQQDQFFNFPGFGFQIPQVPQYKQLPEKKKQTVGRGTGFFISSDGMILTNKHVISDEKLEYSIITSDGKSLPAKILATDPLNDLAVLKVAGEKFSYLAMGDSDKIKIGQTVVAIGFALGEFKNTVTKGVVSGINRNITAGGGGQSEQLDNVIQTDAAINPGNSGGPLLNLKGEIIGINTAISNQGQLIGFAIPVNVAKHVAESIKKFGKIIRPFLGIRYIIINEVLAKEQKLPVNYGALIVRGEQQTDLAVTPGSAADKAGLKENDIILELNGQKITQDNSLAQMVQKYQPGNEMTLKVLSKGVEKTIKLVLGEYKE
jgi:serine protease Do